MSLPSLSKQRIAIPEPIKERLIQQIQRAEEQPPELKSVKLQRSFRELLQSTVNADQRFFHLASFYIDKLKQESVHLDHDYAAKLLQTKSDDPILKDDIEPFGIQGKRNLVKLLIARNLLFHNRQAVLLENHNLRLFKEALRAMTPDELIANLKNFKITRNLNTLAKAFMDLYNNDAKAIQEILEIAYGSKKSFKEAIDDEQTTNTTPYDIKSNLQDLLVEVIKLDQGADYAKLTENYIEAPNDHTRNQFANLIKTKFGTEAAIEFFQGQAMQQHNSAASSIELELQKHAISQYAELKPKNCTETLINILISAKHPSIVQHLLSELCKQEVLNGKKLFDLINNQIDLYKSSSILLTLLESSSSHFTDFLTRVKLNSQNFLELLCKTIPNLKSLLDTLDSDLELAQAQSKTGIIDWIKSKIPVSSIVANFISQNSNRQEQSNSLALIERIDDESMISLHRSPTHSPEFTASQALKEILKTVQA